jgi:hypothetical protein
MHRLPDMLMQDDWSLTPFVISSCAKAIAFLPQSNQPVTLLA